MIRNRKFESRKLTLEQRIARLEKLLSNRRSCKNETFGVDFRPGNLVEDVDGYTAEVVDSGTLGDLWDKYQLDLCDNNMREIWDYMDEDPDWRNLTECVIVRYDDTTGMKGGDCAICIDPENSLDLLGDRRDDDSELLFKRECNGRRCESRRRR